MDRMRSRHHTGHGWKDSASGPPIGGSSWCRSGRPSGSDHERVEPRVVRLDRGCRELEVEERFEEPEPFIEERLVRVSGQWPSYPLQSLLDILESADARG